METILGIRGKDFVMLAADATQARSIVVMKNDEKKIFKISDKIMFAVMGESGDVHQFTEYIAKNIALYKMRNSYDLTPQCAAHYTRKNLAEYLRSRNAYHVNLFVAGYDKDEGSELYFIDYLANGQSLKHAGQGYGAIFCSSIMDRHYKDDITEAEAYDILKLCVAEIQKRLVINQKIFNVAVVDQNGMRDLAPISVVSQLLK